MLGNDRRLVGDEVEIRLGWRVEREHDLIRALDGDARQRSAIRLPDRVDVDRLVGLHRVEGVGDVRRAERLAVAPLHAVADRECERLEVARPLRGGREPGRGRTADGCEDVHELQRLVHEPDRRQRDGRIERVEVACPRRTALVVDHQLPGGHRLRRRGRRGRRGPAAGGDQYAQRGQRHQPREPFHRHPPFPFDDRQPITGACARGASCTADRAAGSVTAPRSEWVARLIDRLPSLDRPLPRGVDARKRRGCASKCQT